MIKAIILGFVGLVLGLFLISYVILPVASDLLARPDIATWTGLGAGLHILGIVLLGSLYFGYLRSVWKSRGSDE
jgi:hypothetical protein